MHLHELLNYGKYQNFWKKYAFICVCVLLEVFHIEKISWKSERNCHLCSNVVFSFCLILGKVVAKYHCFPKNVLDRLLGFSTGDMAGRFNRWISYVQYNRQLSEFHVPLDDPYGRALNRPWYVEYRTIWFNWYYNFQQSDSLCQICGEV